MSNGRKFDEDKADFTLLPFDALEGIVRVMMYGAEKYDRDNWQELDDAEFRYIAAAFRHLGKQNCGVELDDESALPHIDHAITSLLMARWHMFNKELSPQPQDHSGHPSFPPIVTQRRP
jgi:hypothetical protein